MRRILIALFITGFVATLCFAQNLPINNITKSVNTTQGSSIKGKKKTKKILKTKKLGSSKKVEKGGVK